MKNLRFSCPYEKYKTNFLEGSLVNGSVVYYLMVQLIMIIHTIHTWERPTRCTHFLNNSFLLNLICVWPSIINVKKGKGLPRQAEVAQGVPVRLRPRIFLTFRHYKSGRSSANRTGRLYPRRNPCYSVSEAESTSGHMVLSGVPRKKSPVTPPGIDPGTVRRVAQCLNHYATQAQ